MKQGALPAGPGVRLASEEGVIRPCCRVAVPAWDLYGSGQPHRCSEPCEVCGREIILVHLDGSAWREVPPRSSAPPGLAMSLPHVVHTPERCRAVRAG